MGIDLATLALLVFSLSIALLSVLLFRRGRGWRLVGSVLLLQALLALAVQVALSTVPFGIGEPLIRVQFTRLLGQTLSALAVVGGVAALVYLGGRWLAARHAPLRWPAALGLLVALPLVASAGMYGLARVSLPERERARDPLKREITLNPNFAASIYAQGTTDNPTVITFGPDGQLYIGDIAGILWVAHDVDNDHKVDRITHWADGFELLVGLVWHDGELFAASSGKIEALRDSDGDGVADQRRMVVDGLPSMVVRPHSNNSLALGPDGRLYFGVGSTTRGQYEPNEHAAAVLSVKPDGTDLQVFARGFGNPFDLAFNQNGALFGGDNSPLGDGDLPDEFNYIVEGEHYGYPYFYGDPPENSTRGALVSFPPHSVPTGTTFYTGNTFPQAYHDTAFVTLWGRGEIANVEVARTAGGDYLSRVSTFGSGFLYPVDAVTGPDGSLYVADFGTSAIYRITYTGAQQ